MYDLGLPVVTYENIEGGHGGAADNKQRAFMSTLMFSFLRKALVEATLASTLAARPPQDGGRRRFANVLYRAKGVAFSGGIAKWITPTATAIVVGFAVIAAVQMKRLR